jgi:dTDP-4-dehydrorhamnose reductase
MSEKPHRKILITGAHGQLGRALARICRERNIEFEGRDIDTLDIGNPTAVGEWIENSNATDVINCAGFTAVDDCEDNEQTALSINGAAVGYLADACNAIDARLVQISTDYVFSGDADRPYVEDDPVAPINAYGRTKLRGEELAAGARRHLVIRTAWLYGHGGRNFVEAIRGQIENGATRLTVVADQRGSPTFCGDLGEAVLDLVDADAQGIVHGVNSGSTSWHGLAVAIAGYLGSDVDVEPVATADLPRPARRPAFSVLDTSRLARVLGREMPSWQDALRRYLEVACES